jgi:hypothetical protein
MHLRVIALLARVAAAVTAAQKKARTSYIFFTLQAKKWLKVMQTTKYGNVYKNALRMRRLYNTVCAFWAAEPSAMSATMYALLMLKGWKLTLLLSAEAACCQCSA